MRVALARVHDGDALLGRAPDRRPWHPASDLRLELVELVLRHGMQAADVPRILVAGLSRGRIDAHQQRINADLVEIHVTAIDLRRRARPPFAADGEIAEGLAVLHIAVALVRDVLDGLGQRVGDAGVALLARVVLGLLPVLDFRAAHRVYGRLGQIEDDGDATALRHQSQIVLVPLSAGHHVVPALGL